VPRPSFAWAGFLRSLVTDILALSYAASIAIRVKRGWVERPEDWEWSSVRHYGCGEVGPVEIESQWTVRKRERAGIFVTLKMRAPAKDPPKRSLDGAPSTPDSQNLG
jgi:hypothetical protein